jgi:hypothetical protein
MKTIPLALPLSVRLRQGRRGMALISVLAVLVLLTLLVVAFLTRATSSRAGAANFRATTTSRLLSDTVVSIVQAQINEATGMTAPASGLVTMCWASQPGAIRVYKADTGGHDNLNTYGDLVDIFRLYSAPARTAANVSAFVGDLPASPTIISNEPATWVDLNMPSTDAEGGSHYPILDIRSPVDPTKVIIIPGFSISSNSTTLATTGGGVSSAPPAVTMPVQWLYVLRDGSVIPPTTTVNSVLTFSGKDPSGGAIAMPTVNNPIVGRIAYWTDDDSCKVNINTAGGDDVVHAQTQEQTTDYVNTSAADSIFWATPMFVSVDDYKLSQFQPAKGEFQRYSGHPATVGLNSLLSSLCGLIQPLDATDTALNPFYSLTPRYGIGGTLSNTMPISNLTSATVVDAEGNGAAIDTTSIQESDSRLYTSVAEMLFSPGKLVSADRPISTLAAAQTDGAGTVERANFFLTAHSSAPELNLYGEPRVSIWPINYNPSFRTPEDNLIAFDSTVRTKNGPEPYFFQRKDPTSTSTDGTLGAEGSYITGNPQILSYLDALTQTTTIPGFGSGLVSKYPNSTKPAQTRQILTEIFDYIRTVNVRDPNFPVADSNGNSQGRYGLPWCPSYTNGTHDGVVQVVPSANNTASGIDPTVLGTGLQGWGTQGNGSFPVLIEASLQFVAMGVGQFTYQPPTLKTATQTLPPITYREIPVPPPQFQTPVTTLAYDQNSSNVPTKANPTFYGDAIYPEDSTAGQLATNDDVVLNNVGYSMSGGTVDSTYGRPADGTTAMQCFLLLTFLNPALCNDVSNPAFCVTVKGLDSMVITSSGNKGVSAGNSTIPLQFPGSVVSGSPNVELFSRMVFNTDMLGTYVGSTSVGYIPWLFETGCAGYESYTQTVVGPTDTFWNSDGQGSVKHLPFYSQMFCVGGIRTPTPFITGTAVTVNGVPTSYVGAPPALPTPNPPTGYNAPGAVLTPIYANKSTFSISSVPLQIFVNTAHSDLKTMNAPSVQEFDVTFPTQAFLIPKIPTTAGRIMGTGTFFGSWVNNTAHKRLAPGSLPSPGYIPDLDDRWSIPYTNYYGTGSGGNGDVTYVDNLDAANDTIQSMVLSPGWSDARDLAVADVPASAYTTHPSYGTLSNMANNIWTDNGDTSNSCSAFYPTPLPSALGILVPYTSYYSAVGDHLAHCFPVVPPPATAGTEMGKNKGAYTTLNGPGDWDNGLGNQTDGPWVNMADDGSVPTVGDVDGVYGTMLAYFQVGNGFSTTQVSTFSPNRMLPSPVMFGSLPTGVSASAPKPWQTLLFQPGSNAVGTGTLPDHPGEKNFGSSGSNSAPQTGAPPDHLFLDLFWMPQSEPYPISQPFSTAGKINLNYEIEPFNYIVRATALRAIFSGEKVALMPDAMAGGSGATSNPLYQGCYKGQLTARDPASIAAYTAYIQTFTGGASGPDDGGQTRLPVDPDATMGLDFSKSKSPRHLNQAGTSGGDTYNIDPSSSDFDSTDDPHASLTNDGALQSGVAAWYAKGNADSLTNTGTRFFKSASEICEMFLVPQGYTWSEFTGSPGGSWGSHSWYFRPNSASLSAAAAGDFALVGDNARERPYSDLYSRLTTKSNVFTVYYTVQSLKNAEPRIDNSPTGADQQHWDETKGGVQGESRGSTIIERYLDPNEAMPDFLTSTANDGFVSLESYYKWRIVETRQFAP